LNATLEDVSVIDVEDEYVIEEEKKVDLETG
jgi:hypothetical protein